MLSRIAFVILVLLHCPGVPKSGPLLVARMALVGAIVLGTPAIQPRHYIQRYLNGGDMIDVEHIIMTKREWNQRADRDQWGLVEIGPLILAERLHR